MAAKARLLILDDEKDILSAFAGLLQRFSYDAKLFSDPAKALEKIALDPASIDLVMTDIRMPSLDGISFVKTIRSLCPKLPIIFMTAYDTDEVRDQVKCFDKVVFLEKPFVLEKVFTETIPSLLEA
jgi:DNA-binding NtrC family response regulator